MSLFAVVSQVSDSYRSVYTDHLLRWFSLVVWVVVWLASQTRQRFVPENFAMLSAMPDIHFPELRLFNVGVLRHSFQREDICFQVLNFYPEGGSVFVELDAVLVVMGRASASLV
jgi:hypothetical protein